MMRSAIPMRQGRKHLNLSLTPGKRMPGFRRCLQKRMRLAAAQASGKPCIILELPGIAVDVDNPSDLRQLLALPGETRAQQLARGWNITDRLLAAESDAS